MSNVKTTPAPRKRADAKNNVVELDIVSKCDNTSLVFIEKGSELEILSTESGINSIVEKARNAIKSMDGGDLKTAMGRKKIRSNAFKATKLKTSLAAEADKLIAGIQVKIEPQLKIIQAIKLNKKKLGADLDQVKVDVNAEVQAVEDEIQRIKDERLAEEANEKLLAEIESHHELALLMNKDIDREISDKKARLVQEKIDSDKRIAEEAATKAKAETEKLAQQKIDDAQLAKQKAINDRVKADNDLIESQANEKRLKDQAEQTRLNNVWLAYISEAYAINDQLNAEAEQKRQSDLAEQKRLSDIELAKQAEINRQNDESQKIQKEKDVREADETHRGSIHRAILQALVTNDIDPEVAKKMIRLAAKGLLPNLTINY